MQSGKSFFNGVVFGKTIRRFWPLWLLYAIVWFFVLPMSLMALLRQPYAPEMYDVTKNVLTIAIKGGALIAFIFAALTAMAVFSHLYNSKSTGMMCVLPVRREGMFLSCCLAGLVPMLLVHVIIALLTLGVQGLYHVADFAMLCQWFAIVSMCTVTFYGFACFCAMLTGQLLIVPAVYAVLSFTAVGLEGAVRYLISSFIYGCPSVSTLQLSFLSPLWKIFSDMSAQPITEYSAQFDSYLTVDYCFNSWGVLAAYCVVGIVFAVFALLLYRHRRMESAGDIVAVRVLRPVFRWCLALACALLLGCLMHVILLSGWANSNAGTMPHMLVMLLFMLVGGVIGWFGANMLMKKTFRVFRCNLRGLAVFCVLLCALSLACELDLFGYEKRVPKPDDVASVTVNYVGNHATFSEADNIRDTLQLHENIIAHKSLYEHTNTADYTLYLIYELKDGKTLLRTYSITSSDDLQPDELKEDLVSLEALFNTSEGLLARKQVSIPVTEQTIVSANLDYEYVISDGEDAAAYATIQLTPRAMYQLYTECILPDLQDGTLGQLYIAGDEDYEDEVYNVIIRMELYDLDSAAKSDYTGDLWEEFYTHPTIYSTRTNAWLTEHGVRLETLAEARAAVDQYYQNSETAASPTDLVIDTEATVEPSADEYASRIVIDVPAA